MIAALVEAALRSLLVAVAVWAGLRAFRIGNVLAQKAAWGLVLASAVAMPLVMPLAAGWHWMPARAALVVPARAFDLLKGIGSQKASGGEAQRDGALAEISPAVSGPAEAAVRPKSAAPARPRTGLARGGASRFPAPAISYSDLSAPAVLDPAATADLDWKASAAPHPRAYRRAVTAAMVGWLTYLAVAAGLLLRLMVGLFAALRLWLSAEPVWMGEARHLADGMHLRASSLVSSPVTIGSAVVLPADYAEWDGEKLRIVLAHERSHIRQGDFYLQLAAGLYAALVWFSPLGWWLKRKLSDLAEAISDRAGLEEAASRSSYAQILLEFAAMPRPTAIGVAMARRCSLSHRIERLLNEGSFRQAFEGTRRRALLAVLLVPAALFAATALVRVEAAGQTAPTAAPQAEPVPAAQAAGQAQPAPEAQPAPDATPETGVSSPDEEAEPDVVPIVPAPAQAGGPAPPAPPTHIDIPPIHIPAIHVEIPPMPPMPPMPAIAALAQGGKGFYFLNGQDGLEFGHNKAFTYWYSNNGDSYAVVAGDNSHFTGTGVFTAESSASIDKARKMAHGEFLWFTRNGKSYFVDDPATIAQIEAMYKPMEELGKKQEALGKQQETLGREQETMGRKQKEASVPTPDMSREMAELNQAMAKLQAKIGKTVTQDELADIQGRLAEIQGRLGALQGEMGSRMGEFGWQQGRLGGQQGRLGAEQGRIGAEQGRLAREADRKVRSIIDESLKSGKAKPVN